MPQRKKTGVRGQRALPRSTAQQATPTTASALLPLGALMMAGFMSNTVMAAEPAAPAKAKELATVNVQADADKPDGARATTTRVGKVLQDPHDVPQAITTVTNSIMEQQQVGSLKEALRNVSGLSFNAAEGGRSGDNMNLRGFYTFGDMYLDGIRDTAQYNRETFNLEQIDVLRGAGAMLFGRGQAGGVINQVSKTPLRKDQYKLTGSIGNQRYQEATADLNKVINDKTAIRVNAMQRDEGSWRNNPVTDSQPEIHRSGLAFSLALNQNTDNQFWVNQYWARGNDNPDYGISFDGGTNGVGGTKRPTAKMPASTFFGNDKTFDISDTAITTLVNELRISPTSQLRSQLRVADYTRTWWGKTPNASTLPDAQGGVGGNQHRVMEYKTITLQSDFSTKVLDPIGMKHELLTGVEYLREDSFRRQLNNFGSTSAPDYRPSEEVSTGGNLGAFTSDSYALYGQDTVEFIPKWKATLGVRRDEMHAKYLTVTDEFKMHYGQNSVRSALSFHPNDETHYYVGWSDSFSPTADLYQLTVKPQPAERSDVIELGAKWMLLDGDLALRTAVYQATKEWERNQDLEATAAILTKTRRTKGIEVELAGRVTEDWEVFAGLALMKAKVLEVAENYTTSGALVSAPADYAGQRARNTPRYTFNLWSTYQVTGHWKLGGGVEAKGNRLGYSPTSTNVPRNTVGGPFSPNTAPSFVRWDAMVEFEPTNHWLFRFNLKNVFDKVYYDAVYDNGGFTIPGPRRTVILTGEYKF